MLTPPLQQRRSVTSPDSHTVTRFRPEEQIDLQGSLSIAVQCTPQLEEKGVQCVDDRAFVYILLARIESLETECTSLRSQLTDHTFCIELFAKSDQDVAYYTGFPSYKMMMTFWRYLGEKVNHLTLWRGQETNLSGTPSCTVSERKLRPIDEMFLCLMHLYLGLQIRDIAFCFNISPATASRIFTTWVNFLYLEFKAIDFQPSREQIDCNMPLCFKSEYPTTRLILDTTEISLETPSSYDAISNLVFLQEHQHAKRFGWYHT